MTRLTKMLAGACAAALFAVMSVVLGSPAAAASLVEVTTFGSNPGNMRMHVYVPDTRPAAPAIVVAMHGCGGSGPGFHQSSEFASLADRYGFIVIYPSATQSAGFGNCFDTWSDAAKRRGGGSDPDSILSMIGYVERTYGGDRNRVYATGSSSGGMMTQHMLAVHPDVFKAGASFMGVPFNCFAGASDYPPGSSRCTGGSMDRTPQQWGDAVRQAYPGFSGVRPRMQLWHGTADTLVPYSLLRESVEQWTNVFGLSQTPTSTDTPQAGWNRSRYADSSGTVQVESYSIQGAGHALPQGGMALYAIQFFGLTSAADTTPPTTPGTPVASGVTATGATLTWTASTDQGGSGLAGYTVYREQGATDQQLGQSTTNSITLTGLSAGTQYQVYVRARDGAGNLSGNSATVTFTTTSTGGDTTPPTAPSGLAASGTTASGTTLTWTAATDDTGVSGYHVLRAPGASGGTFTQVGTSATTSYADTGLTANTTYRYQVRAYDAAGNVSPVSGTVQITTAPGGTTGGCSATPTVQSQWGNGYVIQPLTITNTGTSTMTGWTVTFTLPPGHTLTGSWNGTVSTSGGTVTVRNVGHNGTLAPGASTGSFGFQATRPNGDTALPSGYTCA